MKKILMSMLLTTALGIIPAYAESIVVHDPPAIATQAEAEAGVNTTNMMTPLRTKQAIDALTPTGGGADKGSFQSNVNLFRNPTNGIVGPVSGAVWAWPGVALTASTSLVYFNQITRPIKTARWVIAWNPNATGASTTGVRLVHADSGPANITEIAKFQRGNITTPVVDAVDITAVMNTLSLAAVNKFLGNQMHGNGAAGATLYLSYIEIVWE